jgi:hypothetical protein
MTLPLVLVHGTFKLLTTLTSINNERVAGHPRACLRTHPDDCLGHFCNVFTTVTPLISSSTLRQFCEVLFALIRFREGRKRRHLQAFRFFQEDTIYWFSLAIRATFVGIVRPLAFVLWPDTRR